MTELLELRLGYEFRQRDLLEAALTHASRGEPNYERLEFLGDRVLGLVVGTWLWERFPEAKEGELTRRFVGLVRESALVGMAHKWELVPEVRLGPGELLKDSILADVVEAILGAVWLEAGLEKVTQIIRRDLADVVDLKDEKDPKSRLQELLQGRKLKLPVYEVVEESGFEHDKYYKIKVSTAVGQAFGEGRSKQVASADAALKLLQDIEYEG